ncbi:RAPGEF2 [Cordylochernes scorpioides]|uniref:RAPGEF2 n=1 Tax=Cordylochernes scorpioides TaxID=51811 RepID=A0ABY6K8P3_9ARAC|nr:RAPGEF2 [Cordylochernes scorpioides]
MAELVGISERHEYQHKATKRSKFECSEEYVSSFGVSGPGHTLHEGTMRAKMEDCQFALVAQSDYVNIMNRGEEIIRRHEENGRVVLLTEQRHPQGYLVIRGTPDHLIRQLLEDHGASDENYVEDFLLTYRTFLPSPRSVALQLLAWLQDPELRDRTARVLLIWVSKHFATDFETDSEMMDLLERMEACLDTNKMVHQLTLLNVNCANKARSRTVTLARSTRDDVLHFSILGGYERGFGIFVSKVARPSKADEVGLRRGDQILEVNGQSFERVSHARALEILRGTTHLSITVRANWQVLSGLTIPNQLAVPGFKEMLNTPENSPRQRKAAPVPQPEPGWPNRSASLVPPVHTADTPPDKKGFMTIGHRRAKLKKALAKINIISKSLNRSVISLLDSTILFSLLFHQSVPGSWCTVQSCTPIPHSISSWNWCNLCTRDKKQQHTFSNPFCINLHLSCAFHIESHLNSSDDSLYSTAGNGTGNQLSHSQSNPDLTATPADYPEHVLKVYKGAECKHLLVHRETTAHEVVMLALREFGLTGPSSDFSLCEVSAAMGGTLKQRRLPDHLASLAERIPLAGRYYLKNNASTEPLVPDDLAADGTEELCVQELLRETQVHLLQLNSVELAAQLTLEDYTVFRQIEPTEYIDDLFELDSPYNTPMLTRFAELVNKEMFWVVTEVCSEHNCSLRMKIIKQFIKVARQCKECHNFNSMFAILSGLGHSAVSRLRQSWEKLPSKYVKIFEDLQDLMDPCRNMCKYRNLLSSDNSPTIPFYPVVKKDLTFIHLGNSSEIGGLVNFEKLRMIAKEVRQLMKMCDSPYDLMSMLEVGTGLTSAMAALNSQATGAIHSRNRQRKKSLSQPQPKKMFEEAQMVRRVKAYLSNLKVIEDEEKLHSLSLDCEPLSSSAVAPLPGNMPSAPSRRRHPSPTLSSASSTSTTSEQQRRPAGPKFGTVSPQAVRKLLSLADNSRVRTAAPPRPPHLQSPAALRQRCHGRSHSDSKPLDAESSSVAGGLLRKSQTISSDSLANDSGHGSSADNSSAGSNHSPSSAPRHRTTGSPPVWDYTTHL